MKDETILKKVIEKAVENGWPKMLGNVVKRKIELGGATKPNYYYFIFDHEFAKAFFGKAEIELLTGEYGKDNVPQKAFIPLWKHHIQQLALAKDRLAYLKKFLK